MNRLLALALASLIAVVTISKSSAGQPRTLDDLDARLAGYPELTIRLTKERIEAPAYVAAGRALLVEENATEADGHAFVLRSPDDVADSDVTDTLAGPAAIEITPEWFWQADFPGNGDHTTPEQSAVALGDLALGRYLAGDPFRSPSEYAQLEVIEEVDLRASRIIDVDASVELFEMGFQLPETARAVRQFWKIENSGAMLQEIAILPVPAGVSQADVETAPSALLAAEVSGDTNPEHATLDALGAACAGRTGEPVAGVGVLSPQRTSWVQIALVQARTASSVTSPIRPGHTASHARHERRLYRCRRQLERVLG